MNDIDRESQSRLHRNAVHEAGHLVVAHKHGMLIEQANVRPGERLDGSVTFVGPPGLDWNSAASLRNRIDIAFSGIAAECVLLGAFHLEGARTDLDYAYDLMLRFARPRTTLRIDLLEDCLEARFRFVEGLLAAAPMRAAVRVFADALVERTSLDSHEIRRLLHDLHGIRE